MWWTFVLFVAAINGLENPEGVGRLPACKFHEALTAAIGLSNSNIVGWNSWNIFACDINQEKILTAAQKTVDLGLRVS
jgi:hypothetical protein